MYFIVVRTPMLNILLNENVLEFLFFFWGGGSGLARFYFYFFIWGGFGVSWV